jgi:SHS2 domain-containing protein
MATMPHPATDTGHRSRPHTADVIIEAWAPTLERCLAEAVAAFTDCFADTSRAAPAGRHEIQIDAHSPDEALAAVLNEALYVLDASGVVVIGTHLQPPCDSILTGWFDLADADNAELIGSVPKGIALSGLHAVPTGDGWLCRAMVDV